MADNTKKTLPNSLEIIQSFGGIRPMAGKLEIPVTTVQGWKKRGAIPSARKELIIKAAKANNIDIAALIEGETVSIAPVKAAQPKAAAKPAPKVAEKEEKNDELPPAQVISSKAQPSTPKQSQAVRPKEVEEQLAVARHTSQSLINGIIGGVSFAAIAGVAGLLFLTGPEVKNAKKQDEKIAALEAQITEMSEQQSALQQIIPSDIDQKIAALKTQTAEMKDNMSVLATQAKEISEKVINAEGGLAERLKVVEGEINRFASLSGSGELANFVAKIGAMQQSFEGQQQLSETVNALWSKVSELESTGAATIETMGALGLGSAEQVDGAVGQLDTALDQSRVESEAVSDTFGGLEKSELKAAAMLMGLAQLRSALGRDNQSFEKDLALLQKMVGSEDKDLNAAINSLAPNAKHGVLSARGLSHQFKGLAGDIVSASLQGEEVSWEEKAKARLNNLVKVEKDGELITGTDTQERIEAAQYYLEKGDVESAIIVLDELNGPARLTANSFIEQMKQTALAGQVETMFTERVMQNVMGFDVSTIQESIGQLSAGNLDIQSYMPANGIDASTFKGLVDSFEQMVPQGKLYHDPVSGYKFYQVTPTMPSLPEIEQIQ